MRIYWLVGFQFEIWSTLDSGITKEYKEEKLNSQFLIFDSNAKSNLSRLLYVFTSGILFYKPLVSMKSCKI